MKQREILLTSIFEIVFVNVEFGGIIGSLSSVESNRDIVQAKCVVEDRCAICSIIITIFKFFRSEKRGMESSCLQRLINDIPSIFFVTRLVTTRTTSRKSVGTDS